MRTSMFRYKDWRSKLVEPLFWTHRYCSMNVNWLNKLTKTLNRGLSSLKVFSEVNNNNQCYLIQILSVNTVMYISFP